MVPDTAPALLFSNRSEVGKVREVNEDYHGYSRVRDWHVFVVADGMGGEVGGQHASRIAVRAVQDTFEQSPGDDPIQLIHRAIQSANMACLEEQQRNTELKGMGTTLDILVVNGNRAWWGHVGDGKIFLIRDGKPEQITMDHTQVQAMLDKNLLSPAEAAEHPQRHVLNRVIGHQPNLVPDVSPEPIPLQNQDALVMCTDGLSDLVTAEEISHLVLEHGPDRACRKLIDLTNSRGGHDNATLQVVYRGQPHRSWRVTRVDEGGGNEDRPRHVWIWVALAVTIAILTLSAAWLLRPTFLDPARGVDPTHSDTSGPGNAEAGPPQSADMTVISLDLFPVTGPGDDHEGDSRTLDGSGGSMEFVCKTPPSEAVARVVVTAEFAFSRPDNGEETTLLAAQHTAFRWSLVFSGRELLVEHRGTGVQQLIKSVAVPSRTQTLSIVVKLNPQSAEVEVIDPSTGELLGAREIHDSSSEGRARDTWRVSVSTPTGLSRAALDLTMISCRLGSLSTQGIGQADIRESERLDEPVKKSRTASSRSSVTN